MNCVGLAHLHSRVFVLLFFGGVLRVFTGAAQTASVNNSAICKQLSIESAQLANQSYLYSQKSYFETRPFISEKNVDTAIYFIKESIFSIDSAIVLASDSDVIAVEYANIARNFAIDSYEALVLFKNSKNNLQKNELSKKATFSSANATTDAYHASFYFKGGKKPEKKQEDSVKIPEKQITKLDIDQSLFTLLNEELREKKETVLKELAVVKENLEKTKDPGKQAKLKTQLKNLEVKEKDLLKKSEEASKKLSSINALIDERDKTKAAAPTKESTVFSKSSNYSMDEWNKQVKLDAELPSTLVYQVQLGVYKNNVLPEIFKGLTPIYGKTTEKGVSYSTGLFEKLADAKEAKMYVINMGLADAFIVAYYNKKKITLPEAIKLEKK